MATSQHPELVEKLTDGVRRLISSDAWQRHLELQSRFHRYSYGNVLLIAAQRQDATQVAGFGTWKRMGRSVRKGERAIFILAPLLARRPKADAAEDHERDTIPRGFRYVPVFDISQTEGQALPAVCDRLAGDDPSRHYLRLVSVADELGFRVEDHQFDGSTNGDCSHAAHRIRVETRNAPAQRVKTLAHELGHALLHQEFDDRGVAELEAESTAYVVCQVLGIDSGDYSFGYVATWAGGGDAAVARIRASCERIQRTAAAILGRVDDHALAVGSPGAGECTT